MLRGRPERAGETLLPGVAFPSGNEPFATEDHPPGICFYKGRESFFFPYALLESMRFQAGKVVLLFAPADVTVEGRGLHTLYVLLAGHRIGRVVEQGERHAESESDAAWIHRVEVTPRNREGDGKCDG